MSGMGGPDEEALHAIIMAENEEQRVREMLMAQQQRPSALYCLDCGEDIPEERRSAVKGCQYCVCCQPKYDKIKRRKCCTTSCDSCNTSMFVR